jgi:hypothetical protein
VPGLAWNHAARRRAWVRSGWFASVNVATVGVAPVGQRADPAPGRKPDRSGKTVSEPQPGAARLGTAPVVSWGSDPAPRRSRSARCPSAARRAPAEGTPPHPQGRARRSPGQPAARRERGYASDTSDLALPSHPYGRARNVQPERFWPDWKSPADMCLKDPSQESVDARSGTAASGCPMAISRHSFLYQAAKGLTHGRANLVMPTPGSSARGQAPVGIHGFPGFPAA